MGYSNVSQYLAVFDNTSSPSWRIQASGIMGSTSLASWIVLLMPQLIEQWKLKSADGISIGFILIWFSGDLFNLIGAVWADLLPEVISLAVWFCLADFLMILSYIYYTYVYPKHHKHRSESHSHHHRHHNHHQNEVATEHENTEEAPLLQRRRSSTLTYIVSDSSTQGVFVSYVLPILFVVGAGAFGYVLSLSSGDEGNKHDDKPINLGSQIVGYMSAFLYLGARIPQIVQNHKRKSVHGLSLLFFLFSVMGNLTYSGQILFYRSDKDYVLLNMSWLLGSLGTILEDSLIFLQFYIYKDNEKGVEAIE